MRERTEALNIGVRNGTWGEDVASRFLRRSGFTILDRNVCPVPSDRRLEIDIIAWDPKTDSIVFVEVKQHATISPYARRISRVDIRKRKNLRRACHAWKRSKDWQGGFRFDVIEVYGTPEGGAPIVDHIECVNLFTKKDRFVKWS